jgi:hypothetical protein
MLDFAGLTIPYFSLKQSSGSLFAGKWLGPLKTRSFPCFQFFLKKRLAQTKTKTKWYTQAPKAYIFIFCPVLGTILSLTLRSRIVPSATNLAT